MKWMVIAGFATVGLMSGSVWGQIRSYDAQDRMGGNQATDETAVLLREIYLIYSVMGQSLQQADEATNRRAAKSLRESAKDLQALGDPYGIQAAMRDFGASLNSVSMVSRNGSPESRKNLELRLRSIKQDLSSFVDQSTLNRIRGQQGEGQAKGSLGALRSALSIFYGDKEGIYPANLSELIPKYLTRIPSLEVAGHPSSADFRILKNAKNMNDLEAQLKDTGRWLYVGDPASTIAGTIVIDCTHIDTRGMKWFKY